MTSFYCLKYSYSIDPTQTCIFYLTAYLPPSLPIFLPTNPPSNQVLSLLNKSVNVFEIWMRLSCMWTFASFHAVSQSVFPMSLCKPPRKKRQISIFKKHSSCLEDWAQPTETKKIRTEPGVDFTPMHILCILGGISKPQIYLKKKKKKKKKRKNIS